MLFEFSTKYFFSYCLISFFPRLWPETLRRYSNGAIETKSCTKKREQEHAEAHNRREICVKHEVVHSNGVYINKNHRESKDFLGELLTSFSFFFGEKALWEFVAIAQVGEVLLIRRQQEAEMVRHKNSTHIDRLIFRHSVRVYPQKAVRMVTLSIHKGNKRSLPSRSLLIDRENVRNVETTLRCVICARRKSSWCLHVRLCATTINNRSSRRCRIIIISGFEALLHILHRSSIN